MGSGTKSEFIALSWLGVASIFASGFMLADAINALRTGENAASAFFLMIVFALIARSDAGVGMEGGQYTRRYLSWRRRD